MGKEDLLNENIIQLLGLETLSDHEKAEILEKMTALIQQKVMLRVMEILADEDKAEMAEIGEDDPEAIVKFLAEKVPNIEEITKEEVLKLKQDMLSATENI